MSIKHRKDKLVIDQQVGHDGEVNKARYMPQSSNLIATKTTSGEVHLFDFFKHPSKVSSHEGEKSVAKPNIRLAGHT